MSHSFRVYDLRHERSGIVFDDVGSYLWTLHNRLHNAIHAATRVYTCRFGRTYTSTLTPYELHWNDNDVPGERLLGAFGWVVGKELIEQIEAEFVRGEAVHLFTFNSDADLCFEEVLVPIVDKG